jgi:hypothetical protein
LQGTFIWDTVRDQAIGDNARFRVRVVQADPSGPVQRVTAASTSYPFRVRAITCIWPELPEVRPSDVLATGGENDDFDYLIAANTDIEFTGKVAAGTGALYYTWDFGNGATAAGQVASHRFSNGYHTVRMAVSGEPCPKTRERAVTFTLKAGTGTSDTMLPAIWGNYAVTTTDPDGVSVAAVLPSSVQASEPLAPVSGLTGDEQINNGALWLRWTAYEGGVEALHVYRSESNAENVEEGRVLVAELPADATGYQESALLCGQIYYVTAVADGRESLPSTSSYYTAPCVSE